MKHLKRIYKFIAMVMILSIVSPFVLSNTKDTVAYAATIKLTKTSLTLDVGKTYTLKATGTTKKVTWTSSKKSIATVSSKGKVTAVKTGATTITASVNGKKLTCRVTVKEPVNPYLKDAPFDAVETKIENISIVVPKKWTYTVDASSEVSYSLSLHPDNATMNSYLGITIYATGKAAPAYKDAKKEFLDTITVDYIKKQYSPVNVDITDLKQSDVKTKSANVFKTEYTVSEKTLGSFKMVEYDFYLNDYFVDVKVVDLEGLGIQSIAEYMLDSLIVK